MSATPLDCPRCERTYNPEPVDDPGVCCVCTRDLREEATHGPEWRKEVVSEARAAALWLVATTSGKHAQVVRAASARGALLSRVKDAEDVPKGGVWAVWKLGNFPAQYEIIDFDPAEVREIGRPHA